MKTTIAIAIAMAAFAIALGSAEARPLRGNSTHDGSWHLSFATQAGPCDPTYVFDVNVYHGVITEPNLVKFRGTVAPNGAARASVAVQDKVASGSGRLTATSGRGTWSGHSGSARCSGYWTAQKQ
jgi:hypothetical protein